MMKYIYGPVASWRLGKSLGVDLLCRPGKTCSFDCIYCQLENTENITKQRQNFIKIPGLIKELKEALKKTKPDVITLSGMGEPTLAKNIDEAIDEIRKITDIPIAILTNSTLFYDEEVICALKKVDIIVAKLDASNPEVFNKISRPAKNITFEETLKNIKKLRSEFKGKFALQIMFMNENKDCAKKLADIAREINPDEVQINTPTRPCSIKPLSVEELDEIEKEFFGLNTISVYHSTKPKTDPLDKIEIFKRRRREV
jgi:wyosine [tRNA(Phe)-imidazoG37] synthetase (radical SAM superfamily)